MKKLSVLIAFILLIAVIPPFIHVRGHLIENERPIVETIDTYPEPDFAKVLYLGFNAFMANIIFIRAAYYFGTHYVTTRTYPLLEQMIRVVMALNPDLEYPIPFAQSAISSMRTPEAIESANSLLRLGHELFPDNYYYIFDQGYNYYMYLGDMEKAYPLMYQGARMEGAPEQLFWLVSRVATMGGGYRLGYEYTRAKLESVKDEHLKDFFETELQHYSNLLFLTEAVQKYMDKTGESPDRKLEKLVDAGIIDEIPEDVFGGYYYYDSENGMVKTITEGDRGYREIQERKRKEEEERKLKEAEKEPENEVPEDNNEDSE